MSSTRTAACRVDARIDPELGITRESTVSARVARTLVEVAEQYGVSRGDLLSAARLGPTQLADADARIDRAKMYQLCELAVDLTRDPALGLHWAERLKDNSLVPISHLMAHSATLRHAFDSLAQFYRLVSDQASHQLLEAGDRATLRVYPLAGESERVQRLMAEMMLAGFFRFIRSFNIHFRLTKACFAHAAPAYQSEYTRVFACPVTFSAPFAEIVFDRVLLDAPAPHKDDDLHAALKSLAERRLLSITQRTPFAQRVRDVLVGKGGPLKADMNDVARALGLSVRSLRRRLGDEGKPYNELAHEAFAIVAQHLLRDKGRTVQEAAYAMGFTDASAFHRAFRLRIGTTPVAFRKAQRD